MVKPTKPNPASPSPASPPPANQPSAARLLLMAGVALAAATASAVSVLLIVEFVSGDNEPVFDPTEGILVAPEQSDTASTPDPANPAANSVSPFSGVLFADVGVDVDADAGRAASASASATAGSITATAAATNAQSAQPKYAFHPHPNPVPEPVPLAGGRTWVPWPTDAEQNPYRQLSGIRPFWEDQLKLGEDYFQAVADLWRTAMPPYTAAAQSRLQNGERLSQKQDGTYARIIDTAGLSTKHHLSDDRRSGWEQIRLCPPHPGSAAARNQATYQLRDTDPARANPAQAAYISQLAQRLPAPDNASGEYTQFVAGMKSPTGLAVPSWGATTSHYARLLAFSPGEPADIASSGHSLTDSGFFPGDWSAQARQLLLAHAAAAALVDTNVWHAIQTGGPKSLWETCQDLAAISIGDNTDSARLAKLETLWSRGIRLSFTSPPTQRAYVAELSPTGAAQALICLPADVVYLTDAATGERLEEFERRPDRVQAQWLRWVIDGYRVAKRASFDGDCDQSDPNGAFAAALAWGRSQADTEADVDTQSPPPSRRASGLNQIWIPVHEWVGISDEQVWSSHRDLGWAKRLICLAGIPRGELESGTLAVVDGSQCTAAELQVLQNAAARAAPRTTELSGTIWGPEDTWFQRMYLSPFKTTEQVLGCSADEITSPASSSVATNRTRVKKPWPPSVFSQPPYFPCPGAQAPPPTSRYWWPPITASTASTATSPGHTPT